MIITLTRTGRCGWIVSVDYCVCSGVYHIIYIPRKLPQIENVNKEVVQRLFVFIFLAFFFESSPVYLYRINKAGEMSAEEPDYTQLPLEERLQHKVSTTIVTGRLLYESLGFLRCCLFFVYITAY